MFSIEALFELAQSLLKTVFIVGCLILFIRYHGFVYRRLPFQDWHQALADVNTHIHTFILLLVLCLFCLAAIDVPYKMYKYYQNLKMSKQEIKKEQKETVGNPEIRARIRGLQRQQAKKRMMSQVKKASVVVTNPTHYAVALRYVSGEDRAPKVVAKGIDHVAQKIKSIASESRIPILESPILARALNKYVELDGEIPGSLYSAVAKVLAYVYRLNQHMDTSRYEEDRQDVPENMYVPE